MAFVVARSGTSATEDAIIGWAREEMANYKVPRAVEFLDELPINATGKVMKDMLRERVGDRSA
jgi:acyl-CoA synthetase (AMP-forming)/AMP-acid ligase II